MTPAPHKLWFDVEIGYKTTANQEKWQGVGCGLM